MCTASKKKKEKGWHLNDNQPLTIRDSLILKVLKGVECRGVSQRPWLWQFFVLYCNCSHRPLLLREFGSCCIKSHICPLLTRTALPRYPTPSLLLPAWISLSIWWEPRTMPDLAGVYYGLWLSGIPPENLAQGWIQRKHSVIGFFSLQSTLKSRLKAAMFPVLPDTCHTHEKLLASFYRRTP